MAETTAEVIVSQSNGVSIRRWISLPRGEQERSERASASRRAVAVANERPRSGQHWFAYLDRCEQAAVRQAMWVSRHPAMTKFNALLNHLGNGWLYAFALVALLSYEGWNGARPAVAASVAVGIAFILYTWLKPRLARQRPCDADPSIRAFCNPLDKYSCPSGHTMTAAAIAIPLLLSFPHLQPLVITIAALVAWSRVACGHHYPTDVVIGGILGTAVSIPICTLIL